MTIESSLKTIMKGKGYLAILLIAVVAGILIFSTGRFPTGLQTGQTSTQPFTVLLSSNPGETSIPINWNSYSGTGFYRVQIKPSNSTSWTNVADVTTTSHTIASVPIVKKGNTYDTRVLAMSGTTVLTTSNELTVWTAGRTTPPPVITPQLILFSGTTTEHSIPLGWYNNEVAADFFRINIKPTGTTQWQYAGDILEAPFIISSYMVSNVNTLLQPGTSYDIQVIGMKGNVTNHQTLATSNTITMGTNLTSSQQITPNLDVKTNESIAVSWTKYSGASYYKVQIKPSGATAWKHVDYTPYLYHSITAADGIPGLQKNTQYDVKVSAILDTAFGPMIIKDSNTLTVITYNY